jgi:hypothetical protein
MVYILKAVYEYNRRLMVKFIDVNRSSIQHSIALQFINKELGNLNLFNFGRIGHKNKELHQRVRRLTFKADVRFIMIYRLYQTKSTKNDLLLRLPI